MGEVLTTISKFELCWGFVFKGQKPMNILAINSEHLWQRFIYIFQTRKITSSTKNICILWNVWNIIEWNVCAVLIVIVIVGSKFAIFYIIECTTWILLYKMSFVGSQQICLGFEDSYNRLSIQGTIVTDILVSSTLIWLVKAMLGHFHNCLCLFILIIV